MSKEKVRVTVVIEYEPNLDHYEGCTTVAEAAAFDELENPFIAYPDAYLDDTKSVTFEAVTVE
ncbi:hypothetical protein ACFVYF_18665 [Streptomyces sp. NPDC058274]|uniref:hypothetical protein n=1 Tax=Streptomyces sp. NPDC058274 TaxID=3346416 RepID=UPI0036E076A3